MPEISPTPLSQTEKYNAAIAYGFLGVFMLLSHDPRFRHPFVRAHARYASIIHLAFILLVIVVIVSGNFGSMLVFDLSVINVLFLILFGSVLVWMGLSTARAFLGRMPRWSLDIMTDAHRDFQTLSGAGSASLIIGHIPIIGRWMAYRYGGDLDLAARYGTWSLIIGSVLAYIDRSMTLVIIWGICVLLWIVYQSVNTVATGHITLLGKALADSTRVHVWTESIVMYVVHLFRHDTEPPHWKSLLDSSTERRLQRDQITLKYPLLIAVPVCNIWHLWKYRHALDIRIGVLQGGILTMLTLVGYFGDMPWLIFYALYAGFEGTLSIIYRSKIDIPLIATFAHRIDRIIRWKSRISAQKETHFNT